MDNLHKHSKLISWLYALFMNLILLVFFAKTCTICFRSNDDWSIANYISGIRGKEFATPYMSFVSILLTKPLYYLYQIYHDLNWFAVAQEFIIFLAMAVLAYIMVRKLLSHNGGVLAFILPLFLVGAFSATFYCRMQYTQTASVGSFSGLLLVIFSYKFDGCKMNIDKIAGIVLAGVSALFRLNCFLLILPFVFVLMLDYAVVPFMKDIFKSNQECRKSFVGYVLAFISQYRRIILILLLMMIAYAGAKYVQSESYSGRYADYLEFNSARAHFIDYDQYDYEQIAEELSALGISENDYYLMQRWTFNDDDITTDLLRSLAELQPKQSGTLREILVSYVIGYIKRNFIGIYFFVLAMLLLLALSGRYKWIYSIALFILLQALDFYFGVIVGRYPAWLVIGVLFATIGTSMYLADLSRLCSMKRHTQILMTIIGGVILFPFGNEWYVENFNEVKYEYSGVYLYEYLSEREDDVFYLPTTKSGAPSLMNGYSVFQSVREGANRNTVSLGGWSTGHPDIIDSYHALGIYSALQQIDQENVYLISQRQFIGPLQTYLYEHTGRTSTYSLTDEQYGASIYKITGDMSGGTRREIYMKITSHGYDSDYDLYEISTQVSVEQELIGREYDVYLAVEDPDTGAWKFVMCYDTEKTSFDETDETVMLKALMPEEYIDVGKSYHISIVLTDEDGNRYYTDNWEQIERVSEDTE